MVIGITAMPTRPCMTLSTPLPCTVRHDASRAYYYSTPPSYRDARVNESCTWWLLTVMLYNPSPPTPPRTYSVLPPLGPITCYIWFPVADAWIVSLFVLPVSLVSSHSLFSLLRRKVNSKSLGITIPSDVAQQQKTTTTKTTTATTTTTTEASRRHVIYEMFSWVLQHGWIQCVFVGKNLTEKMYGA